MDKKGFTLMDLITVISILSILFIIALPKINAAFKESRADQLEEVREMVADATKVYLNDNCGKQHMDILKTNGNVTIYLNSISDCGLIKDKVYNPVSGDYVNLNNAYVIANIDEVGYIDFKVSF